MKYIGHLSCATCVLCGGTAQLSVILTELKQPIFCCISRVSNQSGGVSELYIMLEIHHSGWESSILG